MERAVEHDAGDRAPVLEGHVLDRLFLAKRGVVDQIVDAAELFQRGFRHGVDGGCVDHVGDGDHRLTTLTLDVLDDALTFGAVVPHVDHHGAARRGELQRHLAADAAAGAGDDRDAALQFVFRHSSSSTVIPGQAEGVNPESRTTFAVAVSGFRVRRFAPSRNDGEAYPLSSDKSIRLPNAFFARSSAAFARPAS